MDILAGAGMVAAMIVVVLNVVFRTAFNSPILGAYEYTGFLTAAVVSLGLAHCAILDGHISIDFLVEKLGERIKDIFEVVTSSLVLFFMAFFTFKVFDYAVGLMESGEVSPTTQTPFYLFVFITGVGFAALSLAIFTKACKALKRGVGR